MLLVGLGTWSAFRSPATIRDQSPIDSAKQTVEQVVTRVDGNLPDHWTLDDGGFDEETCSITPMRDGIAATRTLTLSGPDGGEVDVLTGLAAQFEHSRLRPAQGTPESFYVDAGNFVAVRTRITGPGLLVVEAKTGCRPRN